MTIRNLEHLLSFAHAPALPGKLAFVSRVLYFRGHKRPESIAAASQRRTSCVRWCCGPRERHWN